MRDVQNLYDGNAFVSLTENDMEACFEMGRELAPLSADSREGYSLRRRYGTEAQGMVEHAVSVIEQGQIQSIQHTEALRVLTGIERGVMPLLAYHRAVDPRKDNEGAILLNALLFGEHKPVKVPEYVRDGLDALVLIGNVQRHERIEAEKLDRILRAYGKVSTALTMVVDNTVGRVMQFMRLRR